MSIKLEDIKVGQKWKYINKDYNNGFKIRFKTGDIYKINKVLDSMVYFNNPNYNNDEDCFHYSTLGDGWFELVEEEVNKIKVGQKYKSKFDSYESVSKDTIYDIIDVLEYKSGFINNKGQHDYYMNSMWLNTSCFELVGVGDVKENDTISDKLNNVLSNLYINIFTRDIYKVDYVETNYVETAYVETANDIVVLNNINIKNADRYKICVKDFYNNYKRLPNKGESLSIAWTKGKGNHIEEVDFVSVEEKIIYFKNPKEHSFWHLNIGKNDRVIENGNGLAWDIIETKCRPEQDKKLEIKPDNNEHQFVYEFGNTRVKLKDISGNLTNIECVIIGSFYDVVTNDILYNLLHERNNQAFTSYRHGFEVIEEKENKKDIIPNWIKELKLGDKIKWRNGINDSIVESNIYDKIYYYFGQNNNELCCMTYKNICYYAIPPANNKAEDKPNLKYSLSNKGELRSGCAFCGDITGKYKHIMDNKISTAELFNKWNSSNSSNFIKPLNDWTEQYRNHWIIIDDDPNPDYIPSASEILYGKKDLIAGDTNYTKGITYNPEFKPQVWKINK